MTSSKDGLMELLEYEEYDDNNRSHRTGKNKTQLIKFALIGAFFINVIFFVYQSIGHPFKNAWPFTTPLDRETVIELSKNNFRSYLHEISFENASAIFNEVSNALKQKNADLNPISVSFFPAYVPEGTLLYHSTSSDGGKIPDSYEWVAMDYEFSYSFAHARKGKQGRHHPQPPHDPNHGKSPPFDDHNSSRPPPFVNGDTPRLLTFEVVKPLDRLIYLGGASAAKTDTGEMDTQYLLSGLTNYEEFNEYKAADFICKWGKEHGGLDGYVRLEVGFEIVICDFHDKLKLADRIILGNETDLVHFPDEAEDESDNNNKRSEIIHMFGSMAGYDWLESGARVYNGEKRILIDYSKFITPLNKTFLEPDTYKRRINNISDNLRNELVVAVETALKTPNNPFDTTNWQLVTDRIVDKFTPIFVSLNASFSLFDIHKDYGTLGTNLTAFTYNFVRRYCDDDDESGYLDRAVWDYSHPYQPIKTNSELLIFNSIVKVQETISEFLHETFELGRLLLSVYNEDNGKLPEDIEARIASRQTVLLGLLDSLNWSIFYRCKNVCSLDEVCYVPSWGPSPLGWNSMLGFEHDADGTKRISKDFVCIGHHNLL